MQKLILLGVLGLIGCEPIATPIPVPTAAQQVIIVQPVGEKPNVTVTAMERRGDQWQPVFGPWPGTVGRNGIARIGTKKEGDGCTPAGVFAISMAFGYAPTCNTKLNYRQVTDLDYWVDDPKSPDYNRWIQGAKPNFSYEDLRRKDDAYRLAAVIEYNTHSIGIVPGRGSAIFLHIWSGPGKPTAGCVALSSDHIETLLKWLDKSKHPTIVIEPTPQH